MNRSEFMAMVDERFSDGRHYPTLDDYSAALAEIQSRQPAPPEIRFTQLDSSTAIQAPPVRCAECRHAIGPDPKYVKCIAPQQEQWADREGSDSFSYASVIRQLQCHGDWWEPSESAAAARQGGHGAANPTPQARRDTTASPCVAPKKPPVSSDTGQPRSDSSHQLTATQARLRAAAQVEARRLGRFRLEMRAGLDSWFRTDQAFDNLEAADRYAQTVRRVQPHIECRIVDTLEP